MIEYLSRIKTGLATIVGMLAVGGGIMTIPTYVATPAELKQMKTEIVTEFNKSMALERDLSRLNNINDNLQKAKIQQRDRPKDKDIADDIATMKADKQIIQQRIDAR